MTPPKQSSFIRKFFIMATTSILHKNLALVGAFLALFFVSFAVGSAVVHAATISL